MTKSLGTFLLICSMLLLNSCGGGSGMSAASPAIVPVPNASGTDTLVSPAPAAQSPEISGANTAMPGASATPSDVPKFTSSPDNSTTLLPPPAPNAASSMQAQVLLTYRSPQILQQSAPARAIPQTATQRTPQYISPSNTKFSITVTAAGGAPTGPYTGTCSTSGCTVAFTANVGANTIAVKLTDTPGTVLSAFTTTQIVQPSTINTFNFTANPVISSAVVTLASATLNAGSSASDVITVNGLDASGNIITGPGNYVDASGSPVSLTVNVSANAAGGRGQTTLSGPRLFTGPMHPPLVLQYNGNWLQSATITVSSSKILPGGTTPATMTTNPRAVEYNVALAADTVTVGPDGNMWYLSFNDNGIGKMKPDGSFTNYTTGFSGSGLSSITPGPDGNLWFTEYFGSRIGRISTAGQITEFTASVPASPMIIVAGSDGRMWAGACGSVCTGSGSYILAVQTSGAMQFASTSGAAADGPTCVARGPDGNIWLGYQNANTISKITPGFKETDYTYSQPNGFAQSSCSVTAGSDGNMWFTDPSQTAIGRVLTNSGAITIFSAGITGNAGISTLVNGPDGNTWFTESNNGIIAKITPTGTVTEYGAANGVPVGVAGIVIGPDGNLWFGDPTNKKIGKFIL